MRNTEPGLGSTPLVLVGVLEQHAAEHARMALDRHRPRPGPDDDSVGLRKRALERAGLHVLLAAPVDDRDALGAELLRLHGDVDRRHAAADDDDPPPDRHGGLVLRLTQDGDVGDRVDDVLEVGLAGQAEFVGRAEPHAEKHRVVIAPELIELDVLAERDAVLRFDSADRQDEGRLPGGEIVDRLVGGDAVFVEPARLAPRLEDGGVHARDRERVGAGESRRPRADDRRPLAGRRRAGEGRAAGLDHRVGGVALQEPDSDRLAFGGLAHAGLLAQGLGRADAGAHAAQNVGVEDRLGRARPIVGGDLADEHRNVDRGRAGLLARGVEAEIAALRLDPGLVQAQRRVEVAEIRVDGLAVEPPGSDVGQSLRAGGDRHGVSHWAAPAAGDNLDRMVKSFVARGVCQASVMIGRLRTIVAAPGIGGCGVRAFCAAA